jgi:hypothetical protein
MTCTGALSAQTRRSHSPTPGALLRLHRSLDGLYGAHIRLRLTKMRTIRPLDQLAAPADRPLKVPLRLGKWRDLDGVGMGDLVGHRHAMPGSMRSRHSRSGAFNLADKPGMCAPRAPPHTPASPLSPAYAFRPTGERGLETPAYGPRQAGRLRKLAPAIASRIRRDEPIIAAAGCGAYEPA